MDISNLKPNQRFVEIHHPADDEKLLGIRVEIMSITDPRMKKIRRKIQDAKLRLDARNKNFKAEEVEENTVETIFSAMLGWEWYNPTGVKGDPTFNDDAHASFEGDRSPAFNQKNATAILKNLEWFADQLAEAIGDQKAFF